MESECVGTDDNKLNAMDSQAPDELVEVWRDLHLPAFAETPQPQHARPAVETAITSVGRVRSSSWNEVSLMTR
jgi:hypothetical protein